MLLNYIKVALRSLLRQKAFSFINITGLAIGIACCILIMVYVADELSYDKFHEHADDIYRIEKSFQMSGVLSEGALTPPLLAETLTDEFGEVVTATRIRNYGYPVMRNGDKAYSEERFFWVDSTFFDVFTVQFVEGSAKNVLTEPNSVVITEKTRQKYFGNEKPVLGRTINADNRRDYIITGVVKGFPSNSHFHFDFLASLNSYSHSTMWLNNSYYTYVRLLPGSDPEAFIENVNNTIVPKYVDPTIQEYTGSTIAQLEQQGGFFRYLLQPMTDIHLHSDIRWEFEAGGNAQYVYMFAIVAAAILLIACVNFMNLSTAKSARRAKEVGIRKTLGSNFSQLLKQFLTESIVMSFIAVILALVIVHTVLPWFNQFAGKEFTIDYAANPWIIPALLLVAVTVGLLAGSYPAFFLSSFRPIAVLSGKLKAGSKNSWLRSALVVFQFSISIVLIIGTVVIYNQLSYIQNKELGFDKEQLVIIHKTDDLGKTGIERLIQRLEEHPNIITASNTQSLPGLNIGSNAWQNPEKPDETKSILLWMMGTDDSFDNALKLDMKEGRYFSRERTADNKAVVLNEAAVKALGFEESPVGKQVIKAAAGPDGEGAPFEVVGVMKDFHFESMHTQIRPMILVNFDVDDDWFGRYVAVRIASNDIRSSLNFIEEQWHELAGKQALEYTFFDEDFAKIYENEQRTGTLFTSFTFLAIFVACLGLFGLAAYTAEQRTKEIGIRKTLGASVGSIIFLLTKEFTKWIIAANLIAWPAAYFFMRNWLNDFHYRIDISYSTFFIAGAAALLIAVVTVSSQAVKASLINPVDSLKHE